MFTGHTWRVVLGSMLLGATMLATLPALQRGQTDTPHYERIASEVIAWRQSGTDFIYSEYPPLTSSFFTLLYVTAHQLQLPFLTVWLIAFSAIVALAVLYAARYLALTDAWLILLGLTLSALLLGGVLVFGRYDYIVALLLLLTWRSFVARRFAASGFFLMAAASFKLVPLCLVPLLLLLTPRHLRRRVFLGMGGSLLLALVIPLLVLGPQGIIDNTYSMLAYHGGRGVGLESLWSTTSMLLLKSQGLKSTLMFHHAAFHNADLPVQITGIAAAVMLVGLAGIYLAAWVNRHTPPANSFFVYATAALLWTLAVSPLLSPQFLLWPLVLIFAKAGERTPAFSVWPVLLTAAGIALMTQWVYPFHFEQLWHVQSLGSLLLMELRTVLLAVLAFYLVQATRQQLAPEKFQ